MNRRRRIPWFSGGVCTAMAFGFGLALLAPGHALAAGTVTLSDPIPTLLDGPHVTTDVNLLAVGARPVQGVAADGVSEIVIAVSADASGQQFTFTVYNDQSVPSASTAEDGALAAVGSTNFDHSQLTTTAVTTNLGAMSFVIYRAPINFARPGGGDDALASRATSIHWSIAGGSQSGTIPLTVLRPPVALIHGLWSDPATWSNFTPLIGDDRFSIFRANYGSLVEPIANSTPSEGSSISANALGFAFNARYVAPQINSFVNSFKTGRNPANIPVADVQADIVAHSMGGNITRTMPLMSGFASATTFGLGNVHKLITIDTPHLGSPLAIDILPASDGKDPNKCVRTLFRFGGLSALLSIETPAGASINGAMGDLRGGTGNVSDMSPALQALLSSATQPPLQTQLIPTAFVAAIASTTPPDQLGHLDVCNQNPSTKGCNYYSFIYGCAKNNGDPLAKAMASGTEWKNDVMSGQDSDALVPWESEYNGDGPAPAPLTAIHSDSLTQLGLGGPGVLQSIAGAPADVLTLLNTWIAAAPPFVGLR